MFEAKWTGEYPTLCFGEWRLYKNGVDISQKIPEDLRCESMGTYGEYSSWSFDDNYLELFDTYTDGLDVADWIAENDCWVDSICESDKEKEQLYYAFQVSDWRSGSCGGCI